MGSIPYKDRKRNLYHFWTSPTWDPDPIKRNCGEQYWYFIDCAHLYILVQKGNWLENWWSENKQKTKTEVKKKKEKREEMVKMVNVGIGYMMACWLLVLESWCGGNCTMWLLLSLVYRSFGRKRDTSVFLPVCLSVCWDLDCGEKHWLRHESDGRPQVIAWMDESWNWMGYKTCYVGCISTVAVLADICCRGPILHKTNFSSF